MQGVGDFDGDGKSDILWRNSTTGQVYLWFMNGTTITSSGSVTYVSSDWVIQGVGDYDGSGRAGILWRNSTTRAGLHLAHERDNNNQHRKPRHPGHRLADRSLIDTLSSRTLSIARRRDLRSPFREIGMPR